MPPTLDGLTVALIGGDEREVILARALLEQGARVLLVGYKEHPELAGAFRLPLLSALLAADAVVAPMSNTDESGRVKAVEDSTQELRLDATAFAAMKGKPLLIGMAKPVIQQLAEIYEVPVVETAENDEIAVLNSIPTAEGAIARAMAELPITVHGSRSVVIGFGRCGITLARMLHGLGAKVTVVARNPAQLARAYEMGCCAIHLDQLLDAVTQADVVYNTVPVLLLTADVINQMPVHTLIIDVASAPGGTDFSAAHERGMKAFLDLGIPGKVAPQTAGEILARTVPRMILELCRRSQ